MPASLTCPTTRNVSPTVCAVVVLPQPLRFDTDRSGEVDRRCGNVWCNDSLHLLPSVDSVLSRSDEPIFIPLSTFAGLPLRGAKVTELMSASACHVVAPHRELYEVAAAWATLPSRFLRELDDGGILRSCAARRQRVSSSFTMATSVVSASKTRDAGREHRRGAEESRAGGTMTIDPVFGAKLDRFLVE